MADPADPGSILCGQCGTRLPLDATFCLQCGARLPDRPSAMGLPAAPKSSVQVSTMIGVSPELSTGTVPSAGAAPSAGAVPSTSALPVRQVANAQRTMLGMSLEDMQRASAVPSPPSAPVSSAQVPVAAAQMPVASGRNNMSTMIGVPLAQSATQSPSPAYTAPFPPPSPTSPVSGQTRIGVPEPDPSAPTPVYPPPHDPRVASSRRRREQPPLMGISTATTDPPPPKHGRGPQYDPIAERIPGLSHRPSAARWIIPTVLGMALLTGGLFVAWQRFGTRAPALRGEVGVGAHGETVLSVAIPGARAGDTVRAQGHEAPVDAAGRAAVPVALADDQVGDVSVPVELVQQGRATSHSVSVFIGYRVAPDLRPLGEDPPHLHLVFHVPDGASLSVGGHAIQVAHRMGIASIDPPRPSRVGDGDGVWRARYPIRVQTAQGAVIEGQYDLRLPRTALRIDAPGMLSLSNDNLVTVRGTSPGAVRVRVGSVTARVEHDTFQADVPVHEGQNPIDVTSWSTAGVPSFVTLTVYRGVTVDDWLRAGGGDLGPAAIASAPPRSGRLRVRARVLGAVQQGADGPTVQVVVQDRSCPNNRCVAWVDLPAGASPAADSTVDVVGETRGVRAYTTQTDERRSDPVIAALSVIPVR